MLLHNLKIAIRNLLKYKLQTTISVLSIAIGIVVLAAVHSLAQRHLRMPQITETEYYDRIYRVTLPNWLNGKGSVDLSEFNADMIRTLKNGGEFQNAENGMTYVNTISKYISQGTFNLGDTIVRKYDVTAIAVEKSFAQYTGYRSAITGGRIGVLKENEVIISQSLAKKLFKEVNPVGAYFEYYVGENHKQSFVIADVYKDLSGTDEYSYCDILLSIDGDIQSADAKVFKIYMTLKEGCTPEQLEDEINVRLEPFDAKVRVEQDKRRIEKHFEDFITIRNLCYLFGSLILIAAIIGFLRMQMQLFWMRKRELSLRIVNGAKRPELFVLLMTEIVLVIAGSVILALMMGAWLERFVSVVASYIDDKAFVLIDNLPLYSSIIGGALLVLCGIIVWFTLERICKNAQGLAANMRGARNHAFRNAMLWLQVTVGMLFVSAALIISVACYRLTQGYILPDDDTPYRESIFIDCPLSANQAYLFEELSALPDVEKSIPNHSYTFNYIEIVTNDSLPEWIRHEGFYNLYIKDTALLDFYNMEVNWIRPELKTEPCILVKETLYNEIEKAGALANGILTMVHMNKSMPVAGTFKNVPFNKKDNTMNFIVIDPILLAYSNYIIVPKKGRYDALLSEVESTIARVEPTIVNRIAFNFYEKQASDIEIMKNVRKAGWVLGCMALLICIMGIYSTVALDTRARRKEVAIRKINGAKPKDIALMFARLYVVLIALALAALMPPALFLQHLCSQHPEDKTYLPIVMLTIASCAIVAVAVALIVGRHVKEIMNVNPSEMIAKE